MLYFTYVFIEKIDIFVNLRGGGSGVDFRTHGNVYRTSANNETPDRPDTQLSFSFLFINRKETIN